MDRRLRSPPTLEDAPADATILDSRLVGAGFRRLEQFSVALTHGDGARTRFSRDLLRVGHVVGVLPVDVAREEVVLIRQFRLAAHLRTGKGDLVEIVAGYVDQDEDPADAARRECIEEIGVEPTRLRELFSFMPAPGQVDELATMFVAAVDAGAVPERAGAAHEAEDTRPVRVAIDAAIAAQREGRLHNGYTVIALQWLALNRERLADMLHG